MPSLDRLVDVSPALRTEGGFTLPSPAIDIIGDAPGYKPLAELPGMNEKDIELVLSRDTLVLKGEKKQESEHEEKNCTLCERSCGLFQRKF